MLSCLNIYFNEKQKLKTLHDYDTSQFKKEKPSISIINQN